MDMLPRKIQKCRSAYRKSMPPIRWYLFVQISDKFSIALAKFRNASEKSISIPFANHTYRHISNCTTIIAVCAQKKNHPESWKIYADSASEIHYHPDAPDRHIDKKIVLLLNVPEPGDPWRKISKHISAHRMTRECSMDGSKGLTFPNHLEKRR